MLFSTCPLSHHLYGDPSDDDDNVHALQLTSLPLEAVCAVLLVVPVGSDSAVHTATALLLWFRGDADVLDNGAVGDVLEAGLCCFLSLNLARGLGDEVLKDGLLVQRSASRLR